MRPDLSKQIMDELSKETIDLFEEFFCKLQSRIEEVEDRYKQSIIDDHLQGIACCDEEIDAAEEYAEEEIKFARKSYSDYSDDIIHDLNIELQRFFNK